VAHQYTDEQFTRYTRLREQSGIDRWFEVVGNHDFHGTESGLYQRIVNSARYWSLIDGNVAIFNLPAERGNAAGLFIPEVEAWLRECIAAHADKNVVVAAHQFPSGTVEGSDRPSRGLYPKDAVAGFLRDVRVDLWLGGHIHSGRRTPACSAAVNGTIFINAASASHTYNTEACNSFVLDLAAGKRDAVARCRDHDRRRFLDDQEVAVRFAHPCEFSASGPTLAAFDLDVPPRYSQIEEEQVTHF